MSIIRVRSKLVYDVQSPTTLLVNVAVASTPHQKVLNERFTVTPSAPETQLPIGEERNRFVRLLLNPGRTTIRYGATVELDHHTQDPPEVEETDYSALPPQVLTYLNPSRYCESDRLANFAMAEFGNMDRNFDRVSAISDWIYKHIDYRSGTTTSLSTACDVLLQRMGVCRDFAHLGVSFCRALGVPARYVSGYAHKLEPPDFHGFFEAYLSGRWYLFDPTQLAPTGGLVRIGAGRDAADTAFATIWGQATLEEKVVAAEATDEAKLPDDDDLAISTS